MVKFKTVFPYSYIIKHRSWKERAENEKLQAEADAGCPRCLEREPRILIGAITQLTVFPYSYIIKHRSRKERAENEKLQAEADVVERQRLAAAAAEKEKKQMEAYRSKMEEMARKKRAEDAKRRGTVKQG